MKAYLFCKLPYHHELNDKPEMFLLNVLLQILELIFYTQGNKKVSLAF